MKQAVCFPLSPLKEVINNLSSLHQGEVGKAGDEESGGLLAL